MPAYYVVLRTGLRFPQAFASKDDVDERMTGEVIVQSGLTKQEAEFEAKTLEYMELEALGVEVGYNQESELWECTVGGKLIGSSYDVCHLCKRWRGCDYENGSCGVLS